MANVTQPKPKLRLNEFGEIESVTSSATTTTAAGAAGRVSRAQAFMATLQTKLFEFRVWR